MDRSFTFIVNPASGRGRTLKLLPRLGAEIEARGIDVEMRVSTSPDDPPRIARDAIERGRVVVACGGDGLVGMLAGVCADEGGTLALVPTGSGNDFARAIGLVHDDPIPALDVLAAGEERSVDLGRLEGAGAPEGGRWFCCVAGTGFDAEANRWANDVDRISGTALYVAATVRTLATYRPRRFRLTVDGETHDLDAWLVAVGNAQSYGGGMRVCPNARLDDGVLDVTVVGPVSKAEFLRTFPRVFKGEHVHHPQVTTLTGARVEIEVLDGRPSPVYADGEDAGEVPLTVSVAPKKLRVIAP